MVSCFKGPYCVTLTLTLTLTLNLDLEQQTQGDALKHCDETARGRLVTVDSVAEGEYIYNNLAPHGNVGSLWTAGERDGDRFRWNFYPFAYVPDAFFGEGTQAGDKVLLTVDKFTQLRVKLSSVSGGAYRYICEVPAFD
jgi:hypothetical protein